MPVLARAACGIAIRALSNASLTATAFSIYIFDFRLRVLVPAARLSHRQTSGYELGDDQRGRTGAWRHRRHYFDHLSCCPNPQSKQGKPARSDERFNLALERFEQNPCRESRHGRALASGSAIVRRTGRPREAKVWRTSGAFLANGR